LPEFGITMPFRPTDFTQVNPHINRVLVSTRTAIAGRQRHERVIDWFCGLGNFTLPLATRAREVLGIEGSEALVARSRDNLRAQQAQAERHGALAPTDFVARNLFEMTPRPAGADAVAEKWLVDPPREGAFALAKAWQTCIRTLPRRSWATQADCLCQLQPGHAGARCGAVGAPGRLPSVRQRAW
jgi:23S rRNA (uracil1939-C5)-methyltransferase